MRRNERRAAVAAKHAMPPPEPADCCEHGIEWCDTCPECDAEVAEMLAGLDGEQRERRAQ